MERCVGDMNLKEVLVFLDDLIIFSSNLEEHEQHLMRVLHRLRVTSTVTPDPRKKSDFKF